MTTGWPVLCLLFLLPQCSPTSTQKQGALNFSQSLRLTLKIRAQVQDLLQRYKEQQFGDRHHEVHTIEHRGLPSFHMIYSQLARMQDWERLSTASKYLHTFWVHLDIRRLQMEKFWKGRTGRMRDATVTAIIQDMSGIQKQLQHLIGQVNKQLASLNRTPTEQASSGPTLEVPTHPSYLPPKQDLWANRQQGYIVLRDLERYLGKLARDFIFLKARQRGRPASSTHTRAA